SWHAASSWAWPPGAATGRTRMWSARSKQARRPTFAARDPLALHLLGHVPGVDQAHDLVPKIGGGTAHQPAAAREHDCGVGPAVAGGGIGDAASAGAPVHPHAGDAELGALAHGVLGDLGPGADHHRIDPARDRLQILITPVPLDLVRVRVDREDLITALAQ